MGDALSRCTGVGVDAATSKPADTVAPRAGGLVRPYKCQLSVGKRAYGATTSSSHGGDESLLSTCPPSTCPVSSNLDTDADPIDVGEPSPPDVFASLGQFGVPIQSPDVAPTVQSRTDAWRWCGLPSQCTRYSHCSISSQRDCKQSICSRCQSRDEEHHQKIVPERVAAASPRRQIKRQKEDVAKLQPPEYGAFHKPDPQGVGHMDCRVKEEDDPQLFGDESPAAHALLQELQQKNYDNALLIGCYIGNVQGTIKALDRGGMPEVMDIDQFTAGYHAAHSGSLPTLRAVLEHDVHNCYSNYFENTVNTDGMTTLLSLMRRGLREIYEYLLFEYGTKLKLVSKGLGCENGLNELDRWLQVLPEITHQGMLDRPRKLILALRQINPPRNVAVTDEEFEQARRNRLHARATVRRLLGVKSNIPVGRQGRKRAAVVGNDDASVSGEGCNDIVHVDVAANFVLTSMAATSLFPKLGPGSDRDRHGRSEQNVQPEVDAESPERTNLKDTNKCIWVCGHCNHTHIYSNFQRRGASLECQSCKKKNLVFLSDTGAGSDSDQDSQDNVAIGLADADVVGAASGFGDRSEVWDYKANEFLAESVVARYLPIFKGSMLWLLDQQRLRDMVRIVEFVKKDNGHIFTYGSPSKALYVLRQGEVNLFNEEHQVADVVKMDERDIKRHGVKILDHHAFLRKCGQYTKTAEVRSGGASLFAFDRKKIEDHCGAETLECIVHDSLGLMALHNYPFLRTTFTREQLDVLSQALAFREWCQSSIIITAGHRTKQPIWVTSGTLNYSTEQDHRKVYIKPYRDHVPPGCSYEPTAMFGLRSFLYDIPETKTVVVTSQEAHVWTLDFNKTPPSLGGVTQIRKNMLVGVYVKYLHRTPLFRGLKLTDPRLQQVADNGLPLDLVEGEELITQGDFGDSLYLVMEGTVSVEVHGREVASLSADIDSDTVQCFGEIAVLDHRPRGATVRVKSHYAMVLKVLAKTIQRVFFSVEALLEEQGLDTAAVLVQERAKITNGTTGGRVHEDPEHVIVPDKIDYAVNWGKAGKPTAESGNAVKPTRQIGMPARMQTVDRSPGTAQKLGRSMEKSPRAGGKKVSEESPRAPGKKGHKEEAKRLAFRAASLV